MMTESGAVVSSINLPTATIRLFSIFAQIIPVLLNSNTCRDKIDATRRTAAKGLAVDTHSPTTRAKAIRAKIPLA